MTSDELCGYVKTLKTKDDFVKFVGLLNQDRVQNGNEWGNNTLEEFLLGLSGFTRNIDGYYQTIGEVIDVENISWRMAGEMLLAATIYEG